MELGILRDAEAVRALEAEWEALFAADPSATPFSHPGWARAWMRHYGGEVTPFVLTVRTEGSLVGLAPLVIVRRGGLRILRVLGKEPADYWDILAAPRERGSATALMTSALAANRRDWDLAVFDALPPLSATGPALANVPGLQLRRRPPIPCPQIELPAELDSYLASLPRKRRGKIRRHLKRVDEGTISVRELHEVTALPAAVDNWHALRLKQWQRAPGKRMMALQQSDRFRDFIRDVVAALLPVGLAELRELRDDGRLVGSYLSFHDGDRYYLFLGGFDPEAARLELGSLNVCLSIRSSIEAGRGYFDFMGGAEAYKYWYGAVDRLMTPLVIGNSRLASRAALGASGLWDRRRGA